MYKLTETVRYHDDAHRLLPGIILERDSWLSALEKRIIIDITALDRQLEKNHPEDYEDMSIVEIVGKHYGSEAVEFLNEVL